MKLTNEQDFKRFLDAVCETYILIKYEANGEESFYAEVQCKWKETKGSPLLDCKHFITYLSSITRTRWIVKSKPLTKRFKFSKTYICQQSSQGKKDMAQNHACRAFVDLKYKKINKDTIRNDKNLKDGLNIVIKINFTHSHENEMAKTNNSLRCHMDTMLKFFEYFNQGMSPPVAKRYNELSIIDLEENLSFKSHENTQINPTLRQIKYMYYQWRRENYSVRSKTDMIDVLKGYVPLLNEKGVLLIVKETPFVAVIITPIMKRFFLSDYVTETIFVDSCGFCDQTNTKVTLVFAAHEVAGAIPLACVIHTAQTEANFTLAFSTVKEALEKNTDKIFSPQIIVTDDCAAERNALRCVFTDSTLLLCTFRVCQEFWRWLSDPKYKIDKEQRPAIMKIFHKILYAKTEQLAKLAFDAIAEIANPEVLAYLENMWRRRDEWCLYKRTNLLTIGNSTKNYMEAIRTFKDVVLQRSQIFNNSALVLFIADKFETYQKLRLLEFAKHDGEQKAEKCWEFVEIAENQFKVTSETNPNLYYTIQTDIAYCDCLEGLNGSYCVHFCAVEQKSNAVLETLPRITKTERLELAKIALGTDDLPETLFSKENDMRDEDVASTSANMHNLPTGENDENYESDAEMEFKDDPETKQEFEDDIQETKNEFSRICDLLQVNYTPEKLTIINQFLNTIRSIETEEQAVAFVTESIQASQKNEDQSISD